MILITGSYNVVGPDNNHIFEGFKNVATGPAYTQAAVESNAGLWTEAFVASLCSSLPSLQSWLTSISQKQTLHI